jgi:hypothetical protein
MKYRPGSTAHRKRNWINGVSDPSTPVKSRYAVIPLTEGVAYDRPQNEDGDGTDHTRVVLEGVGGLLVAFARVCIPFHVEFLKGSPEYEERIRLQAERVEREMTSLPPLRMKGRTADPGDTSTVLGSLPKGVRWQDLRVCYCRSCGIRLLGESHEVLRRFAVRRKMRCVRHLPPPVAARPGGVPYCGECGPGRACTIPEGR